VDICKTIFAVISVYNMGRNYHKIPRCVLDRAVFKFKSALTARTVYKFPFFMKMLLAGKSSHIPAYINDIIHVLPPLRITVAKKLSFYPLRKKYGNMKHISLFL
jgi:hypothetical protein